MGHDRGVAIIKDGTVIGAISQERLDRIKHSSSSKIPVEAINSLLEYLNLSFKDISCIGISYNSVEGLSVENFYKEELEEIYDCTHTPIFFQITILHMHMLPIFHLVLMKHLFLWLMVPVIILMACKKLKPFLLLKKIK